MAIFGNERFLPLILQLQWVSMKQIIRKSEKPQKIKGESFITKNLSPPAISSSFPRSSYGNRISASVLHRTTNLFYKNKVLLVLLLVNNPLPYIN